MPMLKTNAEINVLIVDDTPLVLTMLSAVLMGLGIKKITTAQSVDAAIEKFSRLEISPFDVVFLDRYLGDQSGIDVLKVIQERHKALPVIMLTQEDQGSKVIEAIAEGASDYIVKPFTEHIIAKKLEQVLGRKLK